MGNYSFSIGAITFLIMCWWFILHVLKNNSNPFFCLPQECAPRGASLRPSHMLWPSRTTTPLMKRSRLEWLLTFVLSLAQTLRRMPWAAFPCWGDYQSRCILKSGVTMCNACISMCIHGETRVVIVIQFICVFSTRACTCPLPSHDERTRMT